MNQHASLYHREQFTNPLMRSSLMVSMEFGIERRVLKVLKSRWAPSVPTDNIEDPCIISSLLSQLVPTMNECDIVDSLMRAEIKNKLEEIMTTYATKMEDE